MKIYKSRFKEASIPVAYHSSWYDFNEFNISYAGKSNDEGDYGRGIYFDTEKTSALAYLQGKFGFLYTCQLNIKPYVIDFKSYTTSKRNREKPNPELERYIEELVQGGLRIPLHHNFDTFLSISRKIGSDSISKAMKRSGYNSIIVNYGNSKEIVVYNEELITIIKKEKV